MLGKKATKKVAAAAAPVTRAAKAAVANFVPAQIDPLIFAKYDKNKVREQAGARKPVLLLAVRQRHRGSAERLPLQCPLSLRSDPFSQPGKGAADALSIPFCLCLFAPPQDGKIDAEEFQAMIMEQAEELTKKRSLAKSMPSFKGKTIAK